jgi:hypothetical protein
VRQIRLRRQRTSGFIYTPELVPVEPAEYALCDEADYPWLSQSGWYLIRNDPYRYAHFVLYVSPDECRDHAPNGINVASGFALAGRWEAYCGPDDRFIGHTDGNTLNNQRSNLHRKKRRRRPRRDLPGGVGIPTLGARTNTTWPTIRREEG